MVRLEIGHLGFLVERAGLEVQAGRVGVRRADVRALIQRQPADHSEHNALVAIVAVDLIARLEGHSGHIGHEAARLCQRDGGLDAGALGLGAVEERAVVRAVALHVLLFGFAQTRVAVLGRVEQLFLLFFCHS